MDINLLVDEVGRENPDVTCAVVIDGAGRVDASQGASSSLVITATALAQPVRELLDRATADLGCGALKATLVEGELASFALADVDGDRTVVLIGAAGAAPGALRADSLYLAERLRGGAS